MPPGDVSRRASLKNRRSSRRGSILLRSPNSPREVPWDIIDRCLTPLLFCHALAILLSTILNVLRISQVSAFTLFLWFALSTIGAVWFYHNLKVTAAGKAILITGCDNVIGNALARRLDEVGFTVFAAFANKADNIDADMLKNDCSGRLKTIQLDATSETQILSASLYIAEHLPDGADGLWALVNAASWCALGELEWVPFSVIRRATDINLLGPSRLIQVMLPLVRRARGRIVNVSSCLCRAPSAVRGVHCALLSALEALSACLRRELRPRGVDVVVVAPGEHTSGTAWLSDATLVEQARDMWRMLSDEQKGVYDEDYFEKSLRSLEKYTKGEGADLTPVTRALCDAVTRSFPLARYTPVTRQEKLQTFVADHFPRSVYDIFFE
ncbi:D-beta-hydroxybutyrate dehydrogenase, mitochondrial [Arctopsyche grandis]|uniref:D-beta-hydroxybutyrate dehydrogenase, mitochondrial n=1 Tax=Arctopsyche grandis TaxID=121162 RepID=UPI00406D7307